MPNGRLQAFKDSLTDEELQAAGRLLDMDPDMRTAWMAVQFYRLSEFIEKNGVGSLKLRVFIQTLGTGVGVGLFYAAAQFAHKVWGIPLPGGS